MKSLILTVITAEVVEIDSVTLEAANQARRFTNHANDMLPNH